MMYALFRPCLCRLASALDSRHRASVGAIGARLTTSIHVCTANCVCPFLCVSACARVCVSCVHVVVRGACVCSASGFCAAWTPTPQQREAYDHLFDIADVSRAGVLRGPEAVQFLSRSSLDRPQLKEVRCTAD
jgi:hypothetical protein